MKVSRLVGLSLAAVLVVGLMMPVWGAQGDTIRISVGPGGVEAHGASSDAVISANGRYIAFESDAPDLVVADDNELPDVFVYDRQSQLTSRVSVDSDGNEAESASEEPAISADGRYVAFVSLDDGLVAGDTNNARDVFVHDRQTGETTRVSVDSEGGQANSVSEAPAISADGRFVAFQSFASNLVEGDTNSRFDIFVHDRQTGETTRVSVDSLGGESQGNAGHPAISGDGRYVAFDSPASDLVPDDENEGHDVFVHDRQTGETTRVSVDSSGNEGDDISLFPALSADGRYVAFESGSSLVAGDTNGWVDVFVHDRQTASTTRVSVSSQGGQADENSLGAAISGDGRYVTFVSLATNLVEGGDNGIGDVYVHDRQTSETVRVSVDSNGAEGNGGSQEPAISSDGRHVVFDSVASNLVPEDTNGTRDVFIHQYLPDPPSPTSTTTTTTSTSTTSSSTTTTASTTTTTTTVPTEDQAFVDTADSVFRDDITAIAEAGITRGCNPPTNNRFCPDDPLTREQMAAFLTRALDLDAAGDQGLVDIAGSVFVEDIDALFASGITRGCNPPANDRYCPTEFTTRGQMAAFLTRALDLDAAGDQGLVDIAESVFIDDINTMFASGITRGCNPPANDRFCPDDILTRGQMAAFLNRALLD